MYEVMNQCDKMVMQIYVKANEEEEFAAMWSSQGTIFQYHTPGDLRISFLFVVFNRS